MALAATLAADGVRPASFLPSIKCSSCGQEIEIAEMGHHICEGAPSQPNDSFQGHASKESNPFELRRINASGQQPPPRVLPYQQSQQPVAEVQFPSPPRSTPAHRSKPSRPALSRINSDVANKPFLAPRQTNLNSPLSPAASFRSGSSGNGRSPIPRSATSPAPRLYDPRPPSPEMSANLDCAFPPFPTPVTTGSRPPTSNGRRTPANGERAASRGASRLDHVMTAGSERLNGESTSSKSSGSENVLQKLSTLKSGPFNANRRQGSNESSTGSGYPEKRRPSEPAVQEVPTRPSTASSNYSLPGTTSIHTSDMILPDLKKTPPERPARPTEEVLSPRFLDQFSAEPASSLMDASPPDDFAPEQSRSGTYPLMTDLPLEEVVHPLSRMRSEPAMKRENRWPLLSDDPTPTSQETLQSGAFPLRGESKTETRVDPRIQDAPPVPRAVQQHRQETSHAPSESGSSITSSNNSRSTASNGVSPVGSVASSLEAFPSLNLESKRYPDDEKMRVPGLNVKGPETPGLRAEQPVTRSPPKNVATLPQETPQKPDGTPTPLESPMDPFLPSLQYSKNAPQPVRPAPLRTQTAPGPVPAALSPMTPAMPFPPRSSSNEASNRSASQPDVGAHTRAIVPNGRNVSATSAQPPPIPQDPRVRPHGRRPTNAKPMCRGCGTMIEGKSVKAADGRLTGRWHKACFVCRSCRQPFTTADFYVINNEPYCEQHYHEKNDSICSGCHRGIEGQYLETSSSTHTGSVEKKFHPRCFCCCECRAVLSDDYFEITGRVYCERHALAAMRAQARRAGGLNPPNQRTLLSERRTTRLINPIMA